MPRGLRAYMPHAAPGLEAAYMPHHFLGTAAAKLAATTSPAKPAATTTPEPTPRTLAATEVHMPSPGLPQNQKDAIAGIVSALDNAQAELFRYADRNYVKAAFRSIIRAGTKQSTMGRAGLAVLNTRLRKATNSWLDFSKRRAWRLRMLKGALTSLQNRQYRAGLNSWKADTAAKKAALLSLAAGAKQWINRAMGAAYRKWAEGLAKLARLRAAARSVLDNRLRKANNSWADFATRRAWRLRMLKGALTSLQNRQYRAGLNSWKADTAAKKLALDRLAKAGGSWIGRAMGAAYRKWAEWWGERLHLRAAFNNVVHGKSRRVLNHWMGFAGSESVRLRLMRMAAGSFASRRYRAALNSWKGELARLRGLKRGAAASMFHSRLRQVRRRRHSRTRAPLVPCPVHSH